MDIETVTKTVEIKGERFPVVDLGTGPAVLLLHGFPDSRFLWRHQIPALTAAGFRVLAPDLRGYGDAPRPTDLRPYRRPFIAADILGLLDALGREARASRRARLGSRHDMAAGGFVPREIRSYRRLVGRSAQQSGLGHHRATGEVVVLRFLHQAGHRRKGIDGRQLEAVSAMEPRSRRSRPTSARPGSTRSADGGAELVSRCILRLYPQTKRRSLDCRPGTASAFPCSASGATKIHSCSNRRWRCRPGSWKRLGAMKKSAEQGIG